MIALALTVAAAAVLLVVRVTSYVFTRSLQRLPSDLVLPPGVPAAPRPGIRRAPGALTR